MKKLSDWRPRSLAVAALLLCVAGGASAADLGFYLVIDRAANTAKVSATDLNIATTDTLYALYGAPQPVDTRVDMKANGYTFTVGYQLGSYFAIEGSYIQFGKIGYDYTFEGAGSDGSDVPGRWKIKARGPTVAAVGLLPLGPYFSLDAHAGFLFLENKHKFSIQGDDAAVFSDNKMALYYGAGAAWWITGQVALRLGYNLYHRAIVYQGPFDKSLFKRDASQYSIGIRYSYGY